MTRKMPGKLTMYVRALGFTVIYSTNHVWFAGFLVPAANFQMSIYMGII